MMCYLSPGLNLQHRQAWRGVQCIGHLRSWGGVQCIGHLRQIVDNWSLAGVRCLGAKKTDTAGCCKRDIAFHSLDYGRSFRMNKEEKEMTNNPPINR